MQERSRKCAVEKGGTRDSAAVREGGGQQGNVLLLSGADRVVCCSLELLQTQLPPIPHTTTTTTLHST